MPREFKHLSDRNNNSISEAKKQGQTRYNDSYSSAPSDQRTFSQQTRYDQSYSSAPSDQTVAGNRERGTETILVEAANRQLRRGEPDWLKRASSELKTSEENHENTLLKRRRIRQVDGGNDSDSDSEKGKVKQVAENESLEEIRRRNSDKVNRVNELYGSKRPELATMNELNRKIEERKKRIEELKKGI